MATISNTPRPGYVYDSTDAVWYPIGTGTHSHSEIASTIVDAKGDIIAASAADTPARLAVGNNGETLVADSSQTTGLAYKPLDAAGKNDIINGGFDIAQRGTSGTFTTTAKSFCFDRWYLNATTSASMTYSQQASTVAGTRYCARVGRTAANTNTTTIALAQDIETSNSITYAGQTVTISFYARAGANFSAASNALTHYVIQGTGTDQSDYSAGFTGRTVLSTGTATLTTSFQRFSYTATVAASTTELNFQVLYVPVGTAGANDYFEVTGVQIELGSTATTFSRAGGTIQGELAACQRYYWRAGDGTGGAYGILGTSGYTSLTTASQVMFVLPVRMRITPTVLDYSAFATTRILNWGAGFIPTAASIAAVVSTPDVAWVEFTSSGMTALQFSQFSRNNDATAFIGFSAEL